MSLKDQMLGDISNFLNANEFAEEITYNGTEITAVVEIGETDTKGNTFSNDGRSDIASVWVAETDVPNPINGDEVTSKGKTWYVARVMEDGGGMYKLELIANEGAM